MPERIEWLPKEELLSLEEIAEICRLASSLGIRKIKITGGDGFSCGFCLFTYVYHNGISLR
jgi:2-iminoacetate synthase ThiH